MLPCLISGAWAEPGETTRFVLFTLLGVAFGCVLHALGRVRGTRSAVVALMAIRLLLFLLAIAWLTRRFGSMAGLGLLLGAVATRAILHHRGSGASEVHLEE